MKSILNKIIFGFCIVISINACHTFEHQNIFLKNFKKNSNQEISEKENENLIVNKNKIRDKNISDSPEMAPINVPKQKEKVEKLTLQKNTKSKENKIFSLDTIKNWTEVNLIKKLGTGDFIKEEGKLKNYQYYFKECFLDVFFIKNGDEYFVNYIETRPTKLYGKINLNACLKEINNILN